MADYREISQEYAKEGIKAALLINGGAAIALLSQAAELVKAGLTDEVTSAMISWTLGTCIAASTWILSFLSTRFVDKSDREAERRTRHLKSSDRFMIAGIFAVIVSLLCFLVGSALLAFGFYTPPA